jgi:predicted RNase H-like nuclease (RuvC/YqgF family)
MGHTVDPLGYNKAYRDEGFTRKLYNRASSWLNILSEDQTVVDAYRVETLEAKLREKDREIESLESKLMREIQDLRYDFWKERGPSD